MWIRVIHERTLWLQPKRHSKATTERFDETSTDV
jgi:hypothetical protein